MKTLILEYDIHVAELLKTVVAGLRSGVSIVIAGTLGDALNLVNNNRFDLYIADRHLPDGSGLDFVKQIRKQDSDAPIVMVSDRTDRRSVLQAARFGINVYMSKPVDVKRLHERLVSLMEMDSGAEVPDIEELLRDSFEGIIQLPSELKTTDILKLMERQEHLTAAELAQHWREEASLTSRLLNVANSSSFRRSGEPVASLKDAIVLLGVPLTLTQALAMSLDISNILQDASLRELARAHHEAALKVAKKAQWLSIKLKKQPALTQTAGLLSRLGELAVLKVLNHYAVIGGEIGAAEAGKILEHWAQPYRNRLMVQWRLPLGVRELVGAVHSLPKNCTREAPLIMRAASMLADGEHNSEECQRLLRRVGLAIGEFERETHSGT